MDLIDLHTHSTASDGTCSPGQVVRKAAALGLKAVALTDHDTVSGLAEAGKAARDAGIPFIRGIELSTSFGTAEVHILGYFMKGELPSERVFASYRDRRSSRNIKMLEKLNALGISITMDEVRSAAGGETVGRPHIANVLIRKGIVRDMAAAFSLYLGAGGAAYVPKENSAPEDAVSLLKGLGCVVSLAHPILIRCPWDELEKLVQRLISCGLDAVEAYHSAQGAADERMFVGLADKYGLLLTGGSDFHGDNKPGIRLGTGKGGLRVPAFLLEKMQEKFPLLR